MEDEVARQVVAGPGPVVELQPVPARQQPPPVLEAPHVETVTGQPGREEHPQRHERERRHGCRYHHRQITVRPVVRAPTAVARRPLTLRLGRAR